MTAQYLKLVGRWATRSLWRRTSKQFGKAKEAPLAEDNAIHLPPLYIQPDPEDATADRPVRVYAFGSSSTEVFDYIFGSTPNYRSHWAAGWSARGLSKEDNRNYIFQCLTGAKPSDIILLHFGAADANFNAAHRIETGNFMKPEAFCREAANGVLRLYEDLQKAGFDNVHIICACAPCRLVPGYYRKAFNLHGIAPRFQAQLQNRINTLIAQKCEIIDISPQLSNANGVLKTAFHRLYPDHHADFCQIQKIVWENIRDLPGVPPHRPDWREAHYGGGFRNPVHKRIKAQQFGAVNLERFEPEYLSVEQLLKMEREILGRKKINKKQSANAQKAKQKEAG